MDRNVARRLPWQIGGMLLVFLLVGCSKSPWFQVSSYNPFRKNPTVDPQYGPTPSRQIAELKKISSTARKLSPAEQQSISTELSLQVQNEVDPTIRVQLVRTLGSLPTASSAEALQVALGDNEADVRIAACEAWRTYGGPRAMNALAEVLVSDTDGDVRNAAARGLADFKDPVSYRALALALEDADPALQYRAVQSLRTASGRNYGNDLDAWKQFAQGDNPPAPAAPTMVERLRNWF